MAGIIDDLSEFNISEILGEIGFEGSSCSNNKEVIDIDEVFNAAFDNAVSKYDDSKEDESKKDESKYLIPANPIWKNRNFDVEIDRCFVIMPFKIDKNLHLIYNGYIKKIIESFDLKCIRADDIFKHEMIMENIWEQICISKFIIGDLTDKNPNVFYELGMAHTLGKRVILITQNDDDVPFDLRHLRYIKYEFTPPGMKIFEDQLKKAINSIL